MLEEENDEQRLARLFQEYLAADERGLRRDTELLALAGASRDSLAAKMRLHRELKALGESDTKTNDPEARQRFGRFEILGSLGEGGISRVLLAFDPKLGRRIALKLIQRELLLDKTQRAWILNEARGLAGTAHRGVVQVYEVGEAGPHTYVAMELLSGPSLHEVIAEWARQRDGGPADGGTAPELPVLAEDRARAEAIHALATRLAPFSRRIELLAELAEALAHCHDHGVLHRDIKPKNVLFDAEGHPKLIDFGLAHVEGADEDSSLGLTQNLVGTVAYLAPEQVTNDRTGADPRSDQFSFGTLAYECFALENPFHRGSQRAIKLAIEEADPPPLGSKTPALPPDVARVVHHALALEREARYPDMGALAADLRAILAHQPISISDPSLTHLGRLWMRRHRRGVRVGGATAALALLAGSMLWGAAALRIRNQILADLRGIRPADFQGAPEFQHTFEPLLDLQRRSRDFDGDGLRSTFFGELFPEVRSTIASWSRALADRHRADVARGEAQGIPLQEGIYRQLFWQESILCPDCPYNLENRRRGRVDLPIGLARDQELSLDLLCRLESITDPDVVDAFRPTDVTDLLVPGTYRLQVWERGTSHLSMESVFFVPEGWPPAEAVAIHAPRDDLLADSVAVERGRRVFPGGAVIVPAFRVMKHLVTVAEFEVFLAETGFEAKDSRLTPGPREVPASVSYDSALAYAAWAGGHLPARTEFFRSLEGKAFAVPQPTPAAGGEYLLDMLPASELTPSWIPYRDASPRTIKMAIRNLSTLTDDRNPVGFRVAFAADEPDVYRHLAENPIEK